MPRRHLLAVPLLAFLACAAQAEEGQKPSGASYDDGYTQGCRKGYEDAGLYQGYAAIKDQARYQADEGYRKGWDEGYARCRLYGSRRHIPL
jgi:hypothetical protein